MVYVEYKMDKLLGWSLMVVLLILSSLLVMLYYSVPSAVMQLGIDIMLIIDGITLLFDIIHCCRHGLSVEHQVYFRNEKVD